MAVAKAIESVADVAHGRLQQIDRLGAIAASFASRGVGGLLAFSLAFAVWRDLAPAITAMTLWWSISYAAIEGRAVWNSGSVSGGAHIAPVLRLALFAAPMGVVMALSSLNTQLPRYLIEASLGARVPAKLLREGVSDLLRISDARMSGTSYGAVVLHVAPESAIGGPLALVQDGDLIRLDVSERRLDLAVDPAELEARQRTRNHPSATTGGGTESCTSTTCSRPTRAATSTSSVARQRS